MKMKTKKAAAKRFKFTATGKVKIKKAGLRHNLGSKNRAQKVGKRKGAYVFEGDVRNVVRSLPYGNQSRTR